MLWNEGRKIVRVTPHPPVGPDLLARPHTAAVSLSL